MAKGKYEMWQEDDNITLLGAWARDGLTQAQIAKNMGIALSTLKEWIKKYPAISAALKKGKELADYEMENALYKKGTGYTVTLRKPIKLKEVEYDNNGKKISEKEKIEYAEVEEYIPPDVTAQISGSRTVSRRRGGISVKLHRRKKSTRMMDLSRLLSRRQKRCSMAPERLRQ